MTLDVRRNDKSEHLDSNTKVVANHIPNILVPTGTIYDVLFRSYDDNGDFQLTPDLDLVLRALLIFFGYARHNAPLL